MIKLEFLAQVDRPIEEVFAFLANVENEPLWQPDLVEAKVTSAGPIGVGSTGRDVRKFMGRQIVTTWQVTEYEPHQKLSFKVVTGPMPFEGSFQLEPSQGSTRLAYLTQAQTKGLSRLFDPLISMMVKGQGRKQMANLKQAIESRP